MHQLALERKKERKERKWSGLTMVQANRRGQARKERIEIL
jgi:hypothetical protein